MPAAAAAAVPDRFIEIWPKCFLIFVGVIEVIAVVLLMLTELGNVAANFWTVNVFAGGWCGVILLIHAITVFAAGKSTESREDLLDLFASKVVALRLASPPLAR